MSIRLQETQDLRALSRIAGTEVEDETDACHSHAERESQVDAGCFVEPWRISEQPGGHDPADVNYTHAERDPRRPAVMWLYVVRIPREQARGDRISAYDLKKKCTVVGCLVLRS